MTEIRIINKQVLKTLRSLNVYKAGGPDGISAIVFKTRASELTSVLTRLYRISLRTAKVLKSWKIANVVPVPKKGSEQILIVIVRFQTYS